MKRLTSIVSDPNEIPKYQVSIQCNNVVTMLCVYEPRSDKILLKDTC